MKRQLLFLFIISILKTMDCYSQSCSVTINPSPAVICQGACITLTANATGMEPFTYLWTTGNTSQNITFCPRVTTIFTVTVTDASNCTSTASATIFVNLIPIVDPSPPASICSGDCVQLSAAGGVSYSWAPSTCLNNPGPTFCCTTPGTYTYTVFVTDGNGCTNSATTTVTVNPLPVITISPFDPIICSGDCVQLTAGGGVVYTWIPSTCLGNSYGLFCCTTPGTYTYSVVGTNVNGCSNTATTSITVRPLPAVQVTPSSAVICYGGSVSLRATSIPACGYTWSPSTGLSSTYGSSVIASPTITTTYTVTTGTGCCIASETITVTVNPLPVAVVSPDITICIGQSVLLSASGGITCTWNPTSGLTSATGCVVISSPASTITYTVTVTDGNGCKDTAHTTVTVDPCTNVNIISKDEGLSFYPNPNDGLFYISLPQTLKAAELTIFNVMGEKVYQRSLTPGLRPGESASGMTSPKERGEIPVHLDVAAGIYFVRIRDGDGFFVQRLMIE